MPRRHKVWVIARKEIKEILRDRRTLFMAIVFPLILYPLLIVGLIQATVVEAQHAERQKPLVVLAGSQSAPQFAKAFEDAENVRVSTFGGRRLPADAAIGVVFPKDFASSVETGGTADVEVLYDSANQASIDALDKVMAVVEKYNGSLLDKRLAAEGLEPAFVHPVKVEQKDVATPRQRGVFKLGKILAFLLVTFCMMGALYPALDTVSGEKERGTLETLLSIPATRLEILAGKYVAVFGMSVASVAANFVSLSMTMFLVNNLLSNLSAGEAPIDFRVPTQAVFLLLPALLPLAAFFSAVSLGIAAYAKSTREGQYYLAPLYAASLPLTAVALVSSARLTWFTALVPITNVSLFLKDGLLGTLSVGPTALAIVATCAYAAMALKWATGVFGREEVLFGAPASEVGEPEPARGLPRSTSVVMAWAVSLILFFYVGSVIARRYGALSLQTSLIINVGFILAPALAVCLLERVRWRKVFPMHWVRRHWLPVALFIPAAICLNVVAGVVQQYIFKAPVAVVTAIARRPESFLTVAVTIALIPAVVEELFYRGFVFRSFAARMSAPSAIVMSAVLFAAAHINVYEALPLFTLGVVLAIVTRSTGTLVVPIIVHFANNFITLVIAKEFPTLGADWGFAAQVVAFVVLAAGGVALLWGGTRLARRET